MEKLKSIIDFKRLQERLIADRDLTIPTLVIPAGTCGQASGANDLIRIAKREFLSKKLTEKIHLRITGCHGFCEMEPSVVVEPRGTFYPKVGLKEMSQIVEAIEKGKVLEGLLWVDGETKKTIEKKDDIPFFVIRFEPFWSATTRSIRFAFTTTLRTAAIQQWPGYLKRATPNG
jgi:NADH-quinone oxidoreductase subunit F